MVTTRPPKTVVEPTALGTVANTNTKLLIYRLFQKGRVLAQDGVAYRLTRETIGTSASLDREWQNDDLLAADETLEAHDYTGAYKALDTDRGHQAPLAGFAGTHFWRVTNILSNITPQKSALNQGPWVRLETTLVHKYR